MFLKLLAFLKMKERTLTELIEKEHDLRFLESFVRNLDNKELDLRYMRLFGGECELEPDEDELLVYQREYDSRGFLPPIG